MNVHHEKRSSWLNAPNVAVGQVGVGEYNFGFYRARGMFDNYRAPVTVVQTATPTSPWLLAAGAVAALLVIKRYA